MGHTQLIEHIRKKFPEVERIEVAKSPEDPESLWIRVAAPEDEEREIALREYGNDKAADILLDYGYHMLVMPTTKRSYLHRWATTGITA
ncbi:hypothetical protein QUF72_10590 [Desulfobacterales bacterium HSG2]|nr:hypothetical protein [Desulfobacterales bacterium HSG2]